MTHMNGIRLKSKQPGGYLQGQADGESLRDAWPTWGDAWLTCEHRTYKLLPKKMRKQLVGSTNQVQSQRLNKKVANQIYT